MEKKTYRLEVISADKKYQQLPVLDISPGDTLSLLDRTASIKENREVFRTIVVRNDQDIDRYVNVYETDLNINASLSAAYYGILLNGVLYCMNVLV